MNRTTESTGTFFLRGCSAGMERQNVGNRAKLGADKALFARSAATARLLDEENVHHRAQDAFQLTETSRQHDSLP